MQMNGVLTPDRAWTDTKIFALSFITKQLCKMVHHLEYVYFHSYRHSRLRRLPIFPTFDKRAGEKTENSQTKHTLRSGKEPGTNTKDFFVCPRLLCLASASVERMLAIALSRERKPCQLLPPSFRGQLPFSACSTWAAPSVLFFVSGLYSP
jgi:hypothetical protein